MNSNFLRKAIIAAVMLACILPLGACGKKPAHVDPPPEVENDTFPHIYPDPHANE